MLIKSLPRLFGTALSAVLLTGCSTGMNPPGGLAGAPAGPAAIEQFLRLAAASDYHGMGWVFGTSDGAILTRDARPGVEQRMFALAEILRYDGFIVGNGSPVPGRLSDVVVHDVIITRGNRNYTVPFTTVRGPQGRWYVEQIGIEAITGR